MAKDIGPRIGIDGDKEYRAAINQIIQQAKTLDAEMKLVASGFDKSTSAEERNAAAKRSSELEYQNRGQYLMQEKKDIARKAAELINDGETVVITSGTTTQAMAEFLLRKKNLTVVTNSVLLCADLAAGQGIELFMLGGKVRNGNFSVSGPISIENLSVFNPDKTIIGIGGISLEKGLTDHRMDETLLTRSCLKAAGVTIGLADHSKFGTVTSYTIGPARMIQYLVTSDITPETVCEPYNREGIRVLRAESTGTAE